MTLIYYNLTTFYHELFQKNNNLAECRDRCTEACYWQCFCSDRRLFSSLYPYDMDSGSGVVCHYRGLGGYFMAEKDETGQLKEFTSTLIPFNQAIAMMQNNEYAIEVYAGTLWEAQLVQSLLKNAEIESYLVNALLNAYAFNPSIAGNVKVMISSNDAEKARIVIDDYFTNNKMAGDME